MHKHWPLRNIYNERWDSLALWVHIYMITATRTWWMMEVIHTFLEEKDYHNKAISWIVRKVNHRISIYMNIFQKTFGFHHSWIMLRCQGLCKWVYLGWTSCHKHQVVSTLQLADCMNEDHRSSNCDFSCNLSPQLQLNTWPSEFSETFSLFPKRSTAWIMASNVKQNFSDLFPSSQFLCID